MTKKEISINTTWDEFEMGTCRLFVAIFDQYIPLVFFQDHKPKPSISNKMMKSINDILLLDENEVERLRVMLHEAYCSTFDTGDKGSESKEEVYAQSKIKEIHIDQENDRFTCIYSEMIIASVANSLVNIIIKDGRVFCLNDGTYFDLLEED